MHSIRLDLHISDLIFEVKLGGGRSYVGSESVGSDGEGQSCLCDGNCKDGRTEDLHGECMVGFDTGLMLY
jgi:hypothetical protein